MTTPYEINRCDTLAETSQQNRVLRNTYMLLGISMVPTVLGALAGILQVASSRHLVAIVSARAVCPAGC